MKGILRKSGDTWYVEYKEETSNSLATSVLSDEPSRFSLSDHSSEKIADGSWEAVEGKRVTFELKSLPLPPYYEADLNSTDMRKSLFGSDTTTPVQEKNTKIRYMCYASFGGNSKKIVYDEIYEGSSIYYFYKHVPLEQSVIEYGAFGRPHERTYNKELIAQFPIMNTAIYNIEKFEEEIK